MILPDKHTNLANSLLGWGAYILESMEKKATVSQIWSKLKNEPRASYHKFILALDLLFMIGIIGYEKGLLRSYNH